MTEPSEYELTMRELDEADDRSLAIVGGAVIEDALQFAISQALGVTADTDEHRMLFRGPLKNNSDKLVFVRALKIVGPKTSADLKAIAEVRNRFAHRLRIRSFDAPEISELVGRIRNRTGQEEPSPRERFRAAAMLIIHELDMAALGVGEADALD